MKLCRIPCSLLLLQLSSCLAKRIQFQGPVLTLTLRDPNQVHSENTSSSSTTTAANTAGAKSIVRPTTNKSTYNHPNAQDDIIDDDDSIALKSSKSWWKRFRPHKQMTPLQNVLNLPSLSPTVLWGIKATNPLPNYFPLLQSASLTASYNYRDLKDKPNYIEGDMHFYSNRLSMDMDVGASYSVPQDTTALSLRLGGSNTESNCGCSALLQIVLQKGQQYLNFIRGQYTWNLPSFQSALSSLTITPTYNFPKQEPSVTVVGKSATGRTAAILDLNWERPVLKVVHALDERNTIQPEICLYDARIMYHWSVKLNDYGSSLKMMVDPTEAIQVSWIDEAVNGKWVTDFRLPLVSGSGLGGVKSSRSDRNGILGSLQSDIRVRRQFVF